MTQECIHHWVLEPFEAAVKQDYKWKVAGRCKKCGLERNHLGQIPISDGIERRMQRWKTADAMRRRR
jgi:hypothetical protein